MTIHDCDHHHLSGLGSIGSIACSYLHHLLSHVPITLVASTTQSINNSTPAFRLSLYKRRIVPICFNVIDKMSSLDAPFVHHVMPYAPFVLWNGRVVHGGALWTFELTIRIILTVQPCFLCAPESVPELYLCFLCFLDSLGTVRTISARRTHCDLEPLVLHCCFSSQLQTQKVPKVHWKCLDIPAKARP